MIRFEIFATGISLLVDRFRHEISNDVLTIYHELLSAKLSEEEFCCAVRSSLYYDQFFPTPAQLVAYAQGSPESKAQKAWRAVLEANPNDPNDRYWNCDDEILLSCVRELGGLRAIHDSNVLDLRWIRDRFIAAYSAELKAQEQENLKADLRGSLPDLDKLSSFLLTTKDTSHVQRDSRSD